MVERWGSCLIKEHDPASFSPSSLAIPFKQQFTFQSVTPPPAQSTFLAYVHPSFPISRANSFVESNGVKCLFCPPSSSDAVTFARLSAKRRCEKKLVRDEEKCFRFSHSKCTSWDFLPTENKEFTDQLDSSLPSSLISMSPFHFPFYVKIFIFPPSTFSSFDPTRVVDPTQQQHPMWSMGEKEGREGRVNEGMLMMVVGEKEGGKKMKYLCGLRLWKVKEETLMFHISYMYHVMKQEMDRG